MEAIGKMPVPAPVLIMGKAALAACIVFAIMKHQLAGMLLYDSVGLQIAAIVLAVAGALLLTLGLISLGRSVAVGLPDEMTQLKTGGVYTICRNPMYLGGYLLCIACCLYALHPLNILCAAIAIGIHHVVITREEEFLQKRFGQAWIDYSHHVHRYWGTTRG